MKKFILIFISSVFLSLSYISFGTLTDETLSSNDAPIIQKLNFLIEQNHDFKNNLNNLLENAKSKEWRGKNIRDFVLFFKNWLTNDPTPDSVMNYIDSIYDLMSENGGRNVIGAEPVDWIRLFMIERGNYLDSRESSASVSTWINDPDIDIKQYHIPDRGFVSFNDFFTRQIKRRYRPVDSSSYSIVSPADGYVWLASTSIKSTEDFTLKNDTMDLKTLFGNDSIYKKFINGSAVIIFLQATDYHHFWAPVSGEIVKEAQLDGFYVADGNPINATNHRRAYYVFKTKSGQYVGMDIIGMYDISSINLIKNVGDYVSKGDEVGHFAYGGSEIILLFSKDSANFSNLPYSPTSTMKVGEKIGNFISK